MSIFKAPGAGVSANIQMMDGPGGLAEIQIRHGQAQLRLCLQGAHITSYRPDGETELLWLSRSAHFARGKSIRGGIPLCWPWFGQHLTDSSQPQHGYARNANFELVSAHSDEQDSRILLKLSCQDKNRQESSTGLRMEFEVRLSDQLWMEIRTTNTGNHDASVGAALHTYFQVEDVEQVRIPELIDLSYKDKIRNLESFRQSEDLQVQSEVDRVYLSPPQQFTLVDQVLNRQVQIQTWGNTDLVVWNPWIEAASVMADFDDRGYQQMLCIEPANALDNQVRLAAGEQHRLGKAIRV